MQSPPAAFKYLTIFDYWSALEPTPAKIGQAVLNDGNFCAIIEPSEVVALIPMTSL